ncbi:MAG: 4'-phosphopantetheinyl transferase superfamily protein [Gammaproteobacteria bacterium]|nr:4'-phosphopantetheinyl transferase superfamily protein [Gammaproteobacteria bacterium]
MFSAQAIDQALARLVPTGATWYWSDDPPAAEPLLAEELDATGGMSPDRLAAFRHGRSCARRALAQLGVAAGPIPMGATREPVWPPGFVGSISHCADFAVAVAAGRPVFRGIGIDLESDTGPLEPAVAKLIATTAERDALTAAGSADSDRLLFAAKESVYKCIWPELRRFVDFTEVEITWHEDGKGFAARPAMPAADLADILVRVSGGYARVSGLLLAVAVLPGTV